jgi:hypothetical protein
MRRFTAILTLYFMSVIPVAAADSFSLYTDVCYNVEGGDLLGHRIGIIRLYDGAYVFLQVAEGNWAQPLIGRASAADLNRGRLVFSVFDEGRPLSFRGTITEKIVTGQFDGWFGDKGKPLMVRLSRISVLKKDVPDCR